MNEATSKQHADLRQKLEEVVKEYKSAPSLIDAVDEWMAGWLHCVEQVVVDLEHILDITKEDD